MSLTVTPQPDATPPRVRIDIATTGSTKTIVSAALYRDGRPLRDRPPAGGTQSVFFDYEAPFGTPTTYRLEAVESESIASYTESWTSLAGWQVTSGTAAVSSGRVRATSALATIRRDQEIPPTGSLVPPSLNATGFSTTILTIGGPGGIELRLNRSPRGTNQVSVTRTVSVGAESKRVDNITAISWTPETVTLQTSTSTIEFATPPTFDDTIVAELTDVSTIGGFAIQDANAPQPLTGQAGTVLEVVEAWLIHPSQPSLSTSIDPGAGRWRQDGLNVDPATAPETTYAAKRIEYEVIGRKRGIAVTTGPRADGEWTLVLFAPRVEDKRAALALIDDQTTLLLRSPDGWPWDLPDGWYSVGDVTVTRVAENLVNPSRRLTFPLLPVDPPFVRSATVRTWVDAILENATWADVQERHATWLDLLTGDAT